VPLGDAEPRLRDLLNDWDPIGVGGEVHDEYDCLIPKLLTRLDDGADTKAIGAFLRAELVDHFGLIAEPGSTDDIAARIVALRPPGESPAVEPMDWRRWHDDYDRPDSTLAHRLLMVQAQIRVVLDNAPAGEINAISVVAGQGRDLIGALADHPRRHDVRAVLVELDPANADFARASARAAGLDKVQVVTGDAADLAHYADYVPARLVLLCGLFGNIADADIEHTVDTCDQLCAQGGTVIWTRARKTRFDRFPLICELFEERDFERRWTSPPDAGFGVGAHRFLGEPKPLEVDEPLFHFFGYQNQR
jgi:ACT domain-containing protein